MVQIDDAGSGSFIGGTCIGFYRKETNEYYFDIIPVELYNKENFKKKLYLDYVVSIAQEAFHNLEVRNNETIEICRGYMFEKLKPWLDANGFKWYSTRITGEAQESVEKSFELYTTKLGLPEAYVAYTRYPFHFHKLLRWVFADYDNRIKLCKVGWKCWSRVEGIVPSVSMDVTRTNAYICLKCGERIHKGSKVNVLKYTSNRETCIYLHDYCWGNLSRV